MTRAGTDHAALLHRAARDRRNYTREDCAITSCTNTSNPSVMIGAGLVAKKAVEAGLSEAGRIMLAGAERIRQLESDVRAERARVDRITAGYSRLMEQAAELVGEAARLVA